MSNDLFWPNRRIDTGFETAEALAACYNRDNWRAHPEIQRLATEESLDTLGWVGQVKKSTISGLMFDGHLRVELALLKNPQMLLPVDYYDLDEDETALALQVHDAITEQAQPIPEKLAALLERTREMTAERPGLRAMLDKLKERAGINGNGHEAKDAAPQIDKAKELQVKWSTALGQVWEMPSQVDGRPHRVVCGDCTDRAVVEAVMKGERANQLVTDPPYNMGSETGLFAQDAPTHYRSTSKLAESNWDYNFDLSLFFENALSVLAEDTTAYVFTSHFLINDIWAWMKDWAKFYSYCVWCKPNPSPSLAKRHWTWGTELVAYGVRGNHTFNYPDGTHALNWWDITTPRHTTEHPTEKPLSVIQRPIEFSSRVGDVVCDPFLGSGTTLIAAHNLHRIARGIEIDPGYVAVCLDRYQSATGLTPRLTSG